MKTKLLRYDVEFFIKEQYPLTIVADRYGGCYSGGKFLAFPRDYTEIEDEVAGSDPECQHYWNTFEDLVGKGNTIQEALDDLMAKMKQEAADGFIHCDTIENRMKVLDLTLPECMRIVETGSTGEPVFPVGGIVDTRETFHPNGACRSLTDKEEAYLAAQEQQEHFAEVVNVKILHLVLKKKWYEMQERGEKTEEYREITPYWCKRFMGIAFAFFSRRHDYQSCNVKEYTHVCFHYGYTKRCFTNRIDSITIGRGNPEWGAPTNRDVFIIKHHREPSLHH